MKIFIVGNGNVGGGLARLWAAAGHETTAVGQQGGDAAGADVVVIAVPGNAVADALSRVTGLIGQLTIDCSNIMGERSDDRFPSIAHEVKSIIGGPTAKSFNTNFAALYDEVAKQEHRPSNVYCADEEARDATEQLIRDAGYEPVSAGGLDQARMQEGLVNTTMAIASSGLGPFFYRIAPPGQL